MTSEYAVLRRVLWAGVLSLGLFLGSARGEEGWRADFEATCARTGEAMELSVPELDALIGRCAALEKVVKAQDESVRKVYLKRLEMCRNLYVYVLEFKKKEQPAR